MSELIPTPVAPVLDRDELDERFKRIQSAYLTDRRFVMSVYHDEIRVATSPVVEILQRTFGFLIDVGKEGASIAKGASSLPALTQKHAASRLDERELLIEGAKTAVLELGDKAEKGDSAALLLLRDIGTEAKKFVLDGAGQQMFFADLASQFGLVGEVPKTLRDEFMVPLLDALTLALTLGAPVARHDAMEGLGALLKQFGDDKQSKLKLPVIDVDAHRKDGDPEVNDAYEHRCKRHELIVLAIAGDDDRRKEYFTKIRAPGDDSFDHRAEYLGALPAICRQAADDRRGEMTADATKFLCEAAIIRLPVGAKPDIEASFARFQESILRTIDAMLERRQVDARVFDVAIAAVVNAIPPTLVGPLDVCNAQTRATVAALSTAALIAASLPESNTDAALKPLFESLGKGWKEWMNPGISEGCLRGLPLLLQDPDHVSWSMTALESLLTHLMRPIRGTNLAALHARLAATAAFRSLLVELAERLRRQQMQVESAEKYEILARDVEYTIRHVLAHPTADEIASFFRKDPRLTTAPLGEMRRNYAEGIVAAAAFSTDVLNRSKMLFDGWERMTPAKQLLLVRILGLQLRSASHGRRELARCKVVNEALAGLAAVRVEESDRTKKLWQLLSDIPAEACVAADSDLQEFVKYKNGTVDDKDDDDDLADYVLGMVSDNVSYQLAADIARQVDLNRHRAMLKSAPFDYAELLYQVMLRGPNIAIFDHLLARTPLPLDRKLLSLLRDHVQTVQRAVAKEREKSATSKEVIIDLTSHAKDLIKKMEAFLEESPRAERSRTLMNLANAMRQFVALGEPVSRIWEVMIGKPREPYLKTVFASVGREDGGLDTFFGRLDALAGDTHKRRRKLVELCADECLQLRQQVEKYLNLTVGAFGPSEDALHAATKTIDAIGEKLINAGLEPPERHILLALIDSWRDMFRYSIDWWVDIPRRCVQAGRPDWYWKYLVNRPAPQPQHDSFPSESSLRIERPHEDAPQQIRYGRAEEAELAIPPEHTRPPIPTGQDGAIERFYVEWTAANLDVDHLRWALEERWDRSGWFGWGYHIITSRLWVIILIMAPCVLAARLHSMERHDLEGIGFYVYLLVLSILTGTALIGSGIKELGLALWRWFRDRLGIPAATASEPQKLYRFQALLPRLFRLIVVPIALAVDFDHSYLFPMHASNAALLMLMILAFLTTSFFVRRELRARQSEDSRLDDEAVVTNQRRRMRQIVSIALAHSFAVALLFSFIFESNFIGRTQEASVALASLVVKGEHTGAAYHQPIEDEAGLYHDEPYFLGVLPREAECNLVNFCHGRLGMSERYAQRMRFHFYPTLILTWTALGLFFGVFLDGFLKGEHLRGEITH